MIVKFSDEHNHTIEYVEVDNIPRKSDIVGFINQPGIVFEVMGITWVFYRPDSLQNCKHFETIVYLKRVN